MLYVLSNSLDPYFNLATEEYLLKSINDNVFMLWRSESAVIVGKHQNTLSEINYKYIQENNLKVARRLSGGGTVVHDLNNLNFSFIANGEEGKLIDFKRFVSPVIAYLAQLGIAADIGKTNDIRIGDLKISGNAEHVYRKRVLHHGTLLFNSDLNQLRKAIEVDKGKYHDKAVQSNRASVTNIIDHLEDKISIEEFTNGLESFVTNKNNSQIYSISEVDRNNINKLVEEKYKTPAWIWGYSPKYTFENNFEICGNKWHVDLFVEKGIIQKSDISINGNNISNIQLTGVWHKYKDVASAIENLEIISSIDESEFGKLIYSFF